MHPPRPAAPSTAPLCTAAPTWAPVLDLVPPASGRLRLLAALPPVPVPGDAVALQRWLEDRQRTSARLAAALLAARRRLPSLRITAQLCTEGSSLTTAIRDADADVVVLRSP